MTTYIKFKLTPGQLPPPGSTGTTISGTDYIIWKDEDENNFNRMASFGTLLPGDITPISIIDWAYMTEEEILDYEG